MLLFFALYILFLFSMPSAGGREDRRVDCITDYPFLFLIRFMTVAAQLNPEDPSDHEEGSQSASDEKEKD